MVNQCETEGTFEFENQIIVFVLLLKFEMMFFWNDENLPYKLKCVKLP